MLVNVFKKHPHEKVTVTLRWLRGLPCPLASRKHPSCDNNSVSDFETACCHHAVMVSQEHCCGSTFNRPDTLPVAQTTAWKQWRRNDDTWSLNSSRIVKTGVILYSLSTTRPGASMSLYVRCSSDTTNLAFHCQHHNAVFFHSAISLHFVTSLLLTKWVQQTIQYW